MIIPDYELGPIRPVAEAGSLILRVTRGCPWNRCAFCTSYKSKNIPYSGRSPEEVKADISRARTLYGQAQFESCFLQDGDIFCLPTDDLIEILTALRDAFPGIKEISSYGIAHKISKKSAEEIKALGEAGLTRVYCGMESGSDRVLKLLGKGSTAEILIRAGQNLMNAGIELSYFLIMGAGGKDLWRESALESARVLNEVNPDFIRVRSLRVKPGSELMTLYEEGDFRLCGEEDMVREQRLLLEHLRGTGFYDNDHSMNLLSQLKGKLPDAKERMLSQMDHYLNWPEEEKRIFHYGVRIGGMRCLSDMKNGPLRKEIEAKIPSVTAHFPDWPEDAVLNYLRVLMTSS